MAHRYNQVEDHSGAFTRNRTKRLVNSNYEIVVSKFESNSSVCTLPNSRLTAFGESEKSGPNRVIHHRKIEGDVEYFYLICIVLTQMPDIRKPIKQRLCGKQKLVNQAII